MKTVMMLLTAKAGMSRDDFIRYYETQHLPLVLRLFPEIRGHFRNYVAPDLFGGKQGFDVIVEMTFADEDSLRKTGGRRDDPAIAAELLPDEERFIDRGKIFICGVDQYRTNRA